MKIPQGKLCKAYYEAVHKDKTAVERFYDNLKIVGDPQDPHIALYMIMALRSLGRLEEADSVLKLHPNLREELTKAKMEEN